MRKKPFEETELIDTEHIYQNSIQKGDSIFEDGTEEQILHN